MQIILLLFLLLQGCTSTLSYFGSNCNVDDGDWVRIKVLYDEVAITDGYVQVTCPQFLSIYKYKLNGINTYHIQELKKEIVYDDVCCLPF